MGSVSNPVNLETSEYYAAIHTCPSTVAVCCTASTDLEIQLSEGGGVKSLRGVKSLSGMLMTWGGGGGAMYSFVCFGNLCSKGALDSGKGGGREGKFPYEPLHMQLDSRYEDGAAIADKKKKQTKFN